MDYEKMYKDALERAKKIDIDEAYASQGTIAKTIFPELAESEDERIRKYLLSLVDKVIPEDAEQVGININDVFVYLEKQKELPFVKDVVLGYPGHYFYDGERMHFCGSPVMEEKQEEPHYTKRNELFDKCVENCDPKTVEEVNKRVDDIINMPELSPFEQALTNFIGYWEDDEEHWPSQFVKKHGKHILDMAREEMQKEQKPNIELIQRSWYMEGYHDREFGKEPKWVIKTGEGGPKHELNPRYGEPLCDEQHPSSRFLPNDWVVYDGPLGHAILQIKDVVAGRYSFVDNDSTLLVEDSDKFLRPLTSKDVEKPAEWSDEDADILNCCISSIEEAKENRYAYKETDGDTSYDREIDWLKSLRPQYHGDVTMTEAYKMGLEAGKSSSWKPSEEQMSMLLAVINDPNNAGAESCYMALKSIYNNLKKL